MTETFRLFKFQKFLKWNNVPSIFLKCPLSFLGISRWLNFKLVSQQYRAWSDCMDMQAGLTIQLAKRVKKEYISIPLISQVGEVSHWPSSWHFIVAAPFSSYPSLQENVAAELYVVVLTSTFPSAGALKALQSKIYKNWNE